MRYLKLFLIYAQIILEAKNLLILTNKYSPKTMETLLRKLYRILPEEVRAEYEEEEFVRYFTSYFKLIQIAVDVLWTFFPNLMHQMTWTYLKATRAMWLSIFEKLRRYAQESEEELNRKIATYSRLYDEKVLMNLLEKDFETQIRQFDFFFTARTELALKEAQEALTQQIKDQAGPREDDNWLVMIDSSGIHHNPNWNPEK
jgi:hypothetical protein